MTSNSVFQYQHNGNDFEKLTEKFSCPVYSSITNLSNNILDAVSESTGSAEMKVIKVLSFGKPKSEGVHTDMTS